MFWPCGLGCIPPDEQRTLHAGGGRDPRKHGGQHACPASVWTEPTSHHWRCRLSVACVTVVRKVQNDHQAMTIVCPELTRELAQCGVVREYAFFPPFPSLLPAKHLGRRGKNGVERTVAMQPRASDKPPSLPPAHAPLLRAYNQQVMLRTILMRGTVCRNITWKCTWPRRSPSLLLITISRFCIQHFYDNSPASSPRHCSPPFVNPPCLSSLCLLHALALLPAPSGDHSFYRILKYFVVKKESPGTRAVYF